MKILGGEDGPVRIESFQFRDLTTGWELEEAKFDAFNLLVGVSGVGKTKILNALRQVQEVALEGDAGAACEWKIVFTSGEDSYEWRASISSDRQFASERITRNGGEALIERNADSFRFGEALLPKLNRKMGAVRLLENEPSMRLLQEGFASLLFAKVGEVSTVLDRDELDILNRLTSRRGKALPSYSTSPVVAGFLFQEALPASWREVKNLFIEVFPSVEDVHVLRRPLAESPNDELVLAIKERGAPTWVEGSAISSGMSRTLIHLIEISLAPAGSVILIDEFENSLGKNCMPQLVDFILSRAPDLQFIITSHHPYIINNLPVSTWKLVQRRGARVSVKSARDIPALQRSSHFDAFDRLLNLPEFEEGIT